MRRIVTGLVAVLVCLLGVTACQGSPKQRTYPDDAIRLRQNVPTPVGDHRLVAVNVQDGRGAVVVQPPQGTATTVAVVPGESYDVAGFAFTVLDVYQDGEASDAPGAGPGRVVITVASAPAASTG